MRTLSKKNIKPASFFVITLFPPWLLMPVYIVLLVGLSTPAIDAEQFFPVLEASESKFTGDLQEMYKRHMIRALVSYNRTNFFISNGAGKGFEYELLEQYKIFVNKKLSRRQIRTEFVYIPVPFDQLLAALQEGRGDIAAAGLTITPEREKSVVFTRPYISNVNEILITGSDIPKLKKLADMAGQVVHVLRGSSYSQHLQNLNEQFRKKGLKPVIINEVDENLQTEDLLEMVNAGVLKIIVADEHIAKLWSQVLPNIRLRSDIAVNEGGQIAWAIRKNNPKLLESLNEFIERNRKGTLIGNVLFKRYYDNTKWINNPLSADKREKLDSLTRIFKKYAKQYDFDWLAIAAQAYQESELDHSKISPAGAIGIMQMLKTTAASKPINIPDIEKLEKNIHAGIKYLAFLREHYFNDPAIAPEDQMYFSYAAYNAGPRKVNRMRSQAKKANIDPNKWFNHVEIIALRMVGQETVRYVRNILKYYTAYRLSSLTSLY